MNGSIDIPSSFAKRHERPLLVMDVPDWDRRSAGSGALAHSLQQWIAQAQWRLLALYKGSILKRLDNGLVMEFADARSCVQAAFALQHLADSLADAPEAQLSGRLRFRASAHLAADVRADGAGRDVELTAALAASAQAGEVLVTFVLRYRLTDGVDAEIEDLGYRRLKPHGHPIRVFRVHRERQEVSDWASFSQRDLRPGLAVMPFQGGIAAARHRMIGNVIADGVIARLSRSIGIRVISAQSTSALSHCGGLGEIERHLGATYVLSGRYSVRGRRLLVHAELAEVRSHTVFWAGQVQSTSHDLFQLDSELLYSLACAVAGVLDNARVGQPASQPLPRLDSSTLMMAGMMATHSGSRGTLERSRKVLTELTMRHPQLALPRVWLGMWYALNVIKGRSGAASEDTRRACEQATRALEAEPGNAMALALEGYIQCQLLGNSQRARLALDASIEANPNEPLAWLFRSLYSAMWDSGSASVAEAYIARSLSPADPLRYFFDLLTANALLTDRQHEQAIAYGLRSLRADRHHVPTLRILLMAQAELGQLEEGRDTLGMLRAELPGLTVSSYLKTGSANSPMRQRMADAMRQLGLPEG